VLLVIVTVALPPPNQLLQMPPPMPLTVELSLIVQLLTVRVA
jgi:hypothetical protein